ncbi:hypothetical protein [Sorangium sp. So ce1389]|uniref:hypothetical protein n=1 Tax=Sorangium sp. So ce1389 TaxID=3133336 RepID=UPI003F61D65C
MVKKIFQKVGAVAIFGAAVLTSFGGTTSYAKPEAPSDAGITCGILTSSTQCNACAGCTWFAFYCDGAAHCGNAPDPVTLPQPDASQAK